MIFTLCHLICVEEHLSICLELDLSSNELSCVIPVELGDISKLKDTVSLDLSLTWYMETFNFSYTNLSGIIRQRRHFNTFNENGYLGNSLLDFLTFQPKSLLTCFVVDGSYARHLSHIYYECFL